MLDATSDDPEDALMHAKGALMTVSGRLRPPRWMGRACSRAHKHCLQVLSSADERLTTPCGCCPGAKALPSSQALTHRTGLMKRHPTRSLQTLQQDAGVSFHISPARILLVRGVLWRARQLAVCLRLRLQVYPCVNGHGHIRRNRLCESLPVHKQNVPLRACATFGLSTHQYNRTEGVTRLADAA